MAGFFPINPGGGVGGGQNPDTAFTQVQLNGDNLVFTRGNGQSTSVSLNALTNGLVEDVELNANGTDLTIIKKDGSTKTVNLTPLLGVREFSYDNNTRVITVIDQNGSRVEVDLSKFARLDEDNIFSGDSNIFKELSLGLPNKTNYIIPSGTYGQAVTQIKTGNRAITSHTEATSKGYVKNLVARVDNVTLGEKINVNIWEVTKGQDRSQDVPKLLHSNLEVEVISSTGYFATGFAIKCPINKKYNKETYFIYQILQPAKLFRATNINPTSNDYIRIDENVDVTTAAIILSRDDLVGVHLLELGDVNIGDLLDNNNGTVTSVNGQTPNDLGAVTVDAEHINYDNTTSQLNSTDVQGAIDEVNNKVGDAYNDSEYDEVNGKLILKKPNGQEDEYRLAGLDIENEFTKVNVMPDLLLNNIRFNNEHYSAVVGDTAGRHFGIKSQSSDLFYDGYVESVRVYMTSTTQGATSINGIRIWSVDKNTDTYGNEITLTQPLPITVEGADTYVDIPIEQTFTNSTYFVFYLPASTTNRFKALQSVNAQYRPDYVNTTTTPVTGQQVPQATDGYSIYAEIRGRISVEDKLMSSYTISDYNTQTGELTLTRHDGTNNTHTLSVGGNYVQSFNYNVDTRTITVTDENGRQHTVPHIITEWDDLDFVSKTKNNIRNIFNKNTQIQKNKYYTSAADIRAHKDWDLAYIPVTPGQQITVVKNAHDSRNYGVYSSRNRIEQDINADRESVNGMVVYRMTISSTLPQDQTYELVVNMHKKPGNDQIDPGKVMVFDGHISRDDLPKEYIPYSLHGSIFIDGNEVVHTFNPQGSTLVSQNTQDAIIELDGKSIKSVNSIYPTNGNVTIGAGHIGYDNTQTQIQANNVQGAIDKLKDDMTLLDTSDIHIVNDNNELNTLLQTQNKVKHGDLIYIINSDSVEDYTGAVVGSVDSPIAMIYDTSLPDTGNELRVFSRFSSSINISADTVTYNDNTTQLTANNVQKAIEKLKEKVDESVTSVVFNNTNNTLTVTKNSQQTLHDLSSLIGVKSINGEVGVDGNIVLSAITTTDKTDLKVGNEVFATVTFITDQQVQEIKDLFV